MIVESLLLIALWHPAKLRNSCSKDNKKPVKESRAIEPKASSRTRGTNFLTKQSRGEERVGWLSQNKNKKHLLEAQKIFCEAEDQGFVLQIPQQFMFEANT